MPIQEMYVKIHAEPEDLALHFAWLEDLGPGLDVGLQRQPEEPDVSVLALSFPLSLADDVDAILRHWEREHPGTIDRDWWEDE